MRFRKRGRAVQSRVDAVEAGALTSIVTELLDLLGHPADQAERGEPDFLTALVNLPAGPVAKPSDPALARLLPDAYGDDDEAAGEFRRYTEDDLRAGKRANAGAVLAGLAPLLPTGGTLRLDREQADAWLGCLNDVRLVLGTRLGVTQETELLGPGDPDDPRSQALHVYSWLGYLQESLLEGMGVR